MNNRISKRTLHRLPSYLSLLEEKEKEGVEYISATTIANILGLNHVQVRKDLSCASNAGKPKIGYETKVLIHDLKTFLDYNNTKDAILIGAGALGKALLGYGGFQRYGLNIVAAFDSDSALDGTSVKGKPVYHISKLAEFTENSNVHIGIITTPASAAQEISDLLVENGVLAIWNFAPVSLSVKPGIIVQNENMATSLAVLSNRLNDALKDKE